MLAVVIDFGVPMSQDPSLPVTEPECNDSNHSILVSKVELAKVGKTPKKASLMQLNLRDIHFIASN